MYIIMFLKILMLLQGILMKKTIITAALKITPKKLQNKALCKALNYLFSQVNFNSFQGATIKFNISDLRKNWSVVYDGNVFKATKPRKVDLEIKTQFNIAINLNNKAVILDALVKEDIQLIGEPSLIDDFTQSVYRLDDRRVADLYTNMFSFFKIKSKQPPRLDIEKVQLSDLKNSIDIDFIRDEALKLEKVDLKKALSLMMLAHQARPNGPLIAAKIQQYQKNLNV